MTPDVASTVLDTEFGEFNFVCARWGAHEEDNVLVLHKPVVIAPPLVRVQSACYTAEIFRSKDCDCHAQLETSLRRIAAEGGAFVYMICDGRGAGLYDKVRGLELTRTQGIDTADAYRTLGLSLDPRNYERVARTLLHIGIGECRLMTNNPRKVQGLRDFGIKVIREPHEMAATEQSAPYLRAKARKLGHLFEQFTDTEGGGSETATDVT